MITTTYETSKTLWDAGVRIKTELCWHRNPKNGKLTVTFGRGEYSAPTFTELVEWIEGNGYEWFYDRFGVYALKKEDDPENIIHSPNSNLTEAAAECCLEVMRREVNG